MAEIDAQPILSGFRILGLHGYKNVSLEFTGPARIVIAENGMGKTTILSALQAFLTNNFSKLQSLSFDSIECDFAYLDGPLTLHRDDLPILIDSAAEEKLRELSQFTETGTTELQNAILQSRVDETFDIMSNPVLRDIYFESPFSREEMFEYVSTIQSHFQQVESDELKELIAAMTSLAETYEILHLPTYRRIEIPLSRTTRRTQRQHSFGRGGPEKWRKKDFANLEIQFGLSDVSNRLTELFEAIQRQSNIGYRSISANIIDDLLAGLLGDDEPSPEESMPEIEALARFFSRIRTTGSPEERLTSLRQLYESGNINNVENATLRYFLKKLAAVVETTEELEANIETFVDKANEYLTTSSDTKILEYDSSEMKVLVRNAWTGEEVELDDLSSGEKQVISVLASLYLYPKKKLVLIDEPELSLSIDWQKRLLPDVLASPFCAQLLAITHSPFIFDNELDPFAGPMSINRAVFE